MNERVALYSSSLYSLAEESGCTEEVCESLLTVRKVLEENKEYVKIVSSAAIPSSTREQLIEDAFGIVHEYVRNFMKLLAKKRIFEIFIPACLEYEKQYKKDNNIVDATITTAVALSDERKAEIARKVSAKLNKRVVAEFVVDESIVGGIVIETDSMAIDASVSGKLEEIRRHISKN